MIRTAEKLAYAFHVPALTHPQSFIKIPLQVFEIYNRPSLMVSTITQIQNNFENGSFC